MRTPTTSSRLAALLPLLLLGSLLCLGTQLAAQDKKKDEVEDPKTTVKPPPKVDDGDEPTPLPRPTTVDRGDTDPKKPPPPPSAVPDTADLVAATRATKNPVLHDFFDSIAVPHDLLRTRSGKVYRISPLETHLGTPPTFTGRMRFLYYQDHEWALADKPWEATASEVSSITYYEQTVPQQVDDLLAAQKKTDLPRKDLLRAAETALTAALRFDESARERGRRRGKPFEEAMLPLLKSKLLDVEVEEMKLLVAGNDWDGALGMARRMAETNPGPKEQQRIAEPLAEAVRKVVEAENYNDEQLRELHRRLGQLEEQFGGPAFAPQGIHKKLRDQAEVLFQRAQDILKAEKNAPSPEKRREALELFKKAELVWPRLPGVHDARLGLENAFAVLRVGVRDLPVDHLSPSSAVTDSERQAVELLFESLVKLCPDADGTVHYEPGLTEGRPDLVPLGRRFQLARQASWSNDQPVTADDVAHTIRLLTKPEAKWPGYSHALGELTEGVQAGGQGRVTVTLRQGFLDPLALMSFKVLPKQPWPEHSLTALDSTRFAQNPVGSGPFVYAGRKKTPSNPPREYASFTANPNYGGRPGKEGLPHIREVQFFVSTDPIKDLQTKAVDLVPDLPTDLVKHVQDLGTYKLLPPQTNRRVYFLAVNHRLFNLQNVDLRKAIAHAINRDKILDDVFRGELGRDVHKPLTGPYPAGSWPVDPALAYKPELAKNRIKAAEAAGVKGVTLTLKYPAGDPRVAKAMDKVAEQVKAEIGLTVTPVAVEPHQLYQDVEVIHDYELAYYHFDHAGDSYWLWPLFDPQATDAYGSNYLGYQNDGLLESQFREVMGRRDFKDVQKWTRILNGSLFDRMPLVPLWQLDTHVVLHPDLQTVPFDPLLLFGDVEQWNFRKK
jgi:ABC-type transport system substrate-binding protein